MTRNTNRASNLLESTKYFGIYETIIIHSWNCNKERKVKVQISMTEAQKANQPIEIGREVENLTLGRIYKRFLDNIQGGKVIRGPTCH